MLVLALVAAWLLVAGLLAVVLGRAVAISDKSDRWRHGHREVRDLRRLHPVPAATVHTTAGEQGRFAA